jgi:hypothetical protein
MSEKSKDADLDNKATSAEESDKLPNNISPGREPKAKRSKRSVESVDVVAHTFVYYVDAKQFCVLKRDFEILEPGQQQSTEWYARADFSAGVSKADAVAALKMIIDEIENAGLPATIRRIDRRGRT